MKPDETISTVREGLDGAWLPLLYAEKVRAERTRSVTLDIPEHENHADIQYTLLGIELKVGKRRFACPDLATARYMRIFARLGCKSFAIPYDITKISPVADEMEMSWQRMLLLLARETANVASRSIAMRRSKLISSIRSEITIIGAGDRMPAFDRPTKQRQ